MERNMEHLAAPSKVTVFVTDVKTMQLVGVELNLYQTLDYEYVFGIEELTMLDAMGFRDDDEGA